MEQSYQAKVNHPEVSRVDLEIS
jgi:hypothetical protein